MIESLDWVDGSAWNGMISQSKGRNNARILDMTNTPDVPPSLIDTYGNVSVSGDAKMCLKNSDCPKEAPLCVLGEHANDVAYAVATGNETNVQADAILLIGNSFNILIYC